MKTIFIAEHHLRHLFDHLNIRDDVRVVINNIVTRFDYDYVKFMHGIISAYSKVYISLMDEHCELTREEARSVMEKLIVVRREINPANIYIADRFDLLYGVSCTGDTRNVKFKDFMYEDMYNRLENLLGMERAGHYMEDVFESIETVTGIIEGSLIAVSNAGDDESEGNIAFYLEPHPQGLLFIII